MDVIKMERNCLGDTRTATHMPTREEFREANWSHKDDVLNLAVAFATELRSRAGNHDWTKVQAPYDEMFYDLMKATIEDGADFMDGEWARLHYDVLERHHLSRHCPDDVTLFDVLEMIFDCVSAGMTRSGKVYGVEISDSTLKKAVTNTVDYLVKHIEVVDRKTENSSEKPNSSTISKMEQVDKDINVRGKWETPPKFEHKGITTTCVSVPACLLEIEDEPQTYKINPKEPTNMPKCFDCEDFFTCDGQCDEIEDEPQTDTEIAKAIVHKMIDDAVIAEDAYPDLRQRMHEAVERLDEYYPSEDERSE